MSANSNVKKKKKWESLEHNGPVFTPLYEPLPVTVNFRYDGKVVKLSQNAEEVAGFYARKLHLPCVNKATFNNNFFNSWRGVMTSTENSLIQDFSKCDFKAIQEYYIKTKNKQNYIKKQHAKKNDEKYGYCIIDGEKQKIKNYKIEPPDIFCSIGESPLMGKIKKRITPEEVTINCSANNIPNAPTGHSWKDVKHINTCFWLASWVSNIDDEIKYILLDEKSNQKQIIERNKYEIARQLHEHIDEVRERYRADWEAEDRGHRQRGVALYFIDSFGFRAGNEIEDNKAADTVGCCSLKVKHVKCRGNNEVEINFIGKASIIYNNNVFVEEPVYNNINSFIENKNEDDDLFDQLETTQLNDFLKTQMSNLSAKVFRTYLACTTFERRLSELTYSEPFRDKKRMVEVFKQANMEVAKLLNHKKTKKTRRKKTPMKKNSSDDKIYATNTSLAYYIDPRIVVTWCERFDIPLKKVYTERLRKKFKWAIDEAGPNFLFSW